MRDVGFLSALRKWLAGCGAHSFSISEGITGTTLPGLSSSALCLGCAPECLTPGLGLRLSALYSEQQLLRFSLSSFQSLLFVELEQWFLPCGS